MRWREIGKKPFLLGGQIIENAEILAMLRDIINMGGHFINPGTWPYVKKVDKIVLSWTRHEGQWRIKLFEEVTEE
jgi:hypothetical protein